MKNQFDAMSTADEVLSGTNLVGKRFLITGATSGIGLETARSLAARGASVVGTSRDLSRSESVTSQLQTAAASGGGTFNMVQLDLASLSSVSDLSKSLLRNGHSFNCVIANAGVMATPFIRTHEGYELQFATNHLGHFALLLQIDPLLADGGRLVVLSSQAHRAADIDLLDPNFYKQAYDPFLAYARSKTANSLFAVEFDRRHKARGIRAASVMPGNSLTSLPRHFSETDLQKLFEAFANGRAEAGLPPPVLKDVPQAAATTVWAAAVAEADTIGGQYLEDCSVAELNDTPPSPFADGVRSYALDAAKALQLWETSLEMVGRKH